MEIKIAKLVTKTLLVTLLAVPVLTACAGPASTPKAASTEAGVAPVTSNAAQPTDAASPTTDAAAASSGPVSFSHDILPIFNETCIKCHGGEKTEKGLDMKTYTSLMAGSERGSVVSPGDSNGSRLAQLVMNGKMPKRGPKLSSEQVQLIVDWINAGAQNN